MVSVPDCVCKGACDYSISSERTNRYSYRPLNVLTLVCILVLFYKVLTTMEVLLYIEMLSCQILTTWQIYVYDMD